MWKKMTALVLCLCLVCTLLVPSFAAETNRKKTAAFIGDSISLGYQMETFRIADYMENNNWEDFDPFTEAFEYEKNLRQGSSNYPWAYPFQFGELVYGKDASPTDMDVNDNIYNYGVSGAQSFDFANMLRGEEIEEGNDDLAGLHTGYTEAVERFPDYIAEMRTNVFDADLVAVAIGGNDIYQNFTGYEVNVPGAEALGGLMGMISMMLQFNASLDSIPLIFEYMGKSMGDYLGSSGETAAAAGAEAGEGGTDAKAMLSSMVGQLGAILKHFSASEMTKFFTEPQEGKTDSIYGIWEKSFDTIVAELIAERTNPNQQIALLSQFNPFGLSNYINLLKQKITSPSYLINLGIDMNTAARLAKTLLTKMGSAEKTVDTDPDKAQKAMGGALQSILDAVLADIDLTNDNDVLYQLIQDVAYPFMVALMGTGFQPMYQKMNTHIWKTAMKNMWSNVVYVDISDAPCSGRFDPHALEAGHTWIAERVYESLCKVNGGTAFRGYIGEGELCSHVKGAIEDATEKAQLTAIKNVAKTMTWINSRLIMKAAYRHAVTSMMIASQMKMMVNGIILAKLFR